MNELKTKGYTVSLTRKQVKSPDLLVVFRSWWEPERSVCKQAKQKGIPIVMINHGAMFVFKRSQTYKKSIAPADVNCLWSEHDKEIWRRHGNEDKLVVTGNPLHDQIVDYSPPEMNIPQEFALFLTSRDQKQVLDEAVESLPLPAIAKCHPTDPKKNDYKKKYQTFDDAQSLLPLLYKCKFILSNVSSAFIPGLYWGKPIFIFSWATKGFELEEFKERFSHCFNFKSQSTWRRDELENPKIPSVEDYKKFGHKPDGKNTQRVVEVIEKTLNAR